MHNDIFAKYLSSSGRLIGCEIFFSYFSNEPAFESVAPSQSAMNKIANIMLLAVNILVLFSPCLAEEDPFKATSSSDGHEYEYWNVHHKNVKIEENCREDDANRALHSFGNMLGLFWWILNCVKMSTKTHKNTSQSYVAIMLWFWQNKPPWVTHQYNGRLQLQVTAGGNWWPCRTSGLSLVTLQSLYIGQFWPSKIDKKLRAQSLN